MTTDLDALRAKIRQLYVKLEKGDLRQKAFQRLLTEFTTDLYRAVLQKRMAKDEAIQREHHTISAHFQWTQSLLREPEQQATSLFATDRRLYCVRSIVIPKQPATADARDRTVVDEIRFDRIGSFQVHRQFRWGEMGVAAVICTVAILFAPWLEVTSHVMLGLGALGVLHGLLLPTKWIEITASEPKSNTEPILIRTIQKKSARNLIQYLRDKVIIHEGNQGSAR
jgi:hypothetical protein